MIYIDAILSLTESTVLAYADDIKIINSKPSVWPRDVNHIVKWLYESGLSLNPHKSPFIFYTKRFISPKDVFVNDCKIVCMKRQI